MKKILFVINTMGRAGAERALITFMKQFPPEEYDLSLLALINRGELFDEVPDHVHVLNRHPDNGSVLSTRGHIKIAFTLLQCFFRRLSGFLCLPLLFRIRNEQKKSGKIRKDKLLWHILANGTKPPADHFDLAIAYLEGASTYYVSRQVHAKQKAAFLHIDYRQAGYTPLTDHGAYDKITRIFTVSEGVRKSFLKVYPNYLHKTFLFRNIIDRERILSMARQNESSLTANLEPGSRTAEEIHHFFSCSVPRLLTVGRLHYQKGYDIAIQALKQIQDAGIPAEWFILGEGPDFRVLSDQIEAAGLAGSFHLCGAISNPYPFYDKADLYVHCTRFEGKSIAIEEAQVLGKAIIASDCTGNKEQIEHEKSGLLVALDPQSVADAVIRLLNCREERVSFETASRTKNLSHPEDFQLVLQLLDKNNSYDGGYHE